MKNKKTVLLGILSLLSFDIFAVTSGSVNISTESILARAKEWTKDMTLSLENETITARDRSNDVNGYQTYLLIEPGYNYNEKLSLSVGGQYMVRQMNEDADQRESDKERNNSDDMENVFVKALYKAAKFKDNGVADIRLQARAYRDLNPLFVERYGNDGNYQLRAYFGRPIYKKFYINKYTSYLRYKKYFLNEDASDFTRDNEIRARISPTYNVVDGLDLSLTMTYNLINLRGNSSAAGQDFEEKFEVSPSIRYQVGKYAVLLRADIPLMQTNTLGSLAENEEAGAKVGYALNFAAYL